MTASAASPRMLDQVKIVVVSGRLPEEPLTFWGIEREKRRCKRRLLGGRAERERRGESKGKRKARGDARIESTAGRGNESVAFRSLAEPGMREGERVGVLRRCA